MIKSGVRALAALGVCGAVGVSGAAHAQGAADPPPALAITGSTALVSQYRFRGISLSDEEPAVQGSINLAHASGLYAGFWASTLDGFGELGGSNLELDLYGGYKLPVGPATLDVGLLYYAYPGSAGGDFEFFEPYANISGTLGPASVKLGVNFAWDQSALLDNSNLYLFGDTAVALTGTPITLRAHLGYSEGDTPLTPTSDYLDWMIGADVTYRNLTLGIAYVDTNISPVGAAASGAGHAIVDDAVVISVTASF